MQVNLFFCKPFSGNFSIENDCSSVSFRPYPHHPKTHPPYVTVISEATKKHLQNLVYVPDEKIVVIPDCIPPEFTYVPREFNTEQPVLLQIGTKYNKNLSAGALFSRAGRP